MSEYEVGTDQEDGDEGLDQMERGTALVVSTIGVKMWNEWYECGIGGLTQLWRWYPTTMKRHSLWMEYCAVGIWGASQRKKNGNVNLCTYICIASYLISSYIVNTEKNILLENRVQWTWGFSFLINRISYVLSYQAYQGYWFHMPKNTVCLAYN